MNILLVAGGGLMADALGCWLRGLAPKVEVKRWPSPDVQRLPKQTDPDCAFVDVDAIPPRRVIATIRSLRDALPNGVVVAIGMRRAQRFAKQILASGADVYLDKSHNESEVRATLEGVMKKRTHGRYSGDRAEGDRNAALAAADLPVSRIRRTRRGEHPYGLTDRELDVLELACYGLTNLQIAKRHGISVGVVKLHLHHAYEKLGVEGRVQAIRIVENLDAIRTLHVQQSESAPSVLDCLLPHMSHERYRRGHVLFRKGEPGHAMFYVHRGRVRLPELDLHMTQGDVFGELGVFAPAHARTSSARCEVDTDLFKLTAEQTKRLCFENPKFAYYVIRLIADRLVCERQ